MILMDGKAAAKKILDGLARDSGGMKKKPRLAVVVAGQDPVIASFIAQKKRAASAVGARMRIYSFPADITTNALRKNIAAIVHEKENDAVIVQLPLPAHINRQYILNAIPLQKDADVLSAGAIGAFTVGKSAVMPPVAGAVAALLKEYGIPYRGAHIVIVGAGSLVGRPIALWLLREGAMLTIIADRAEDRADAVRAGDIVISGVGKPGLIRGDMIKKGAVVIDAGSSESSGAVVGDADRNSVASSAAYLAPVPGGVGPLTVAMLLKNLFILARA